MVIAIRLAMFFLVFSSSAFSQQQQCKMFYGVNHNTGKEYGPATTCAPVAAQVIADFNDNKGDIKYSLTTPVGDSGFRMSCINKEGYDYCSSSGSVACRVVYQPCPTWDSPENKERCQNNAARGTTNWTYTYTTRPQSSVGICRNGCVANTNFDPNKCSQFPDGMFQCRGTGAYTGTTCDPDAENTTSTPQTQSSSYNNTTATTATSGVCTGYVNDRPVEYKCAPDSSSTSSTSSSASSDGSTKTSVTTTTCDKSSCTVTNTTSTSGTSTSTSSTPSTTPRAGCEYGLPGAGQSPMPDSPGYCSRGDVIELCNSYYTSCGPNTSNTTTPATPPTSSTSTVTKTRSDFCEENPSSKMCIDSSFSGTCSSGYTCDGDAVQCAQARAAYEINCNVDSLKTDSKNATVQKGMSALAAGDRPADHPYNDKKNVTVGVFDQSNPLGGSCPSDVQLNQYVSIPLSKMCDGLLMLGKVLVAFSLLVAMRITMSAV